VPGEEAPDGQRVEPQSAQRQRLLRVRQDGGDDRPVAVCDPATTQLFDPPPRPTQENIAARSAPSRSTAFPASPPTGTATGCPAG
jgi:hypothetical protein